MSADSSIELTRARRRLPAIGWAHAPVASVALVVIGFISTALSLLVTVVGALVIGRIPAAVGEGWSSPAGRDLRLALIATAVIFVGSHTMSSARAIASQTLELRVEKGIRQKIMRLVTSAPGVAHLEDPAISDLVERARGSGHTQIGPGQAVSGFYAVAEQWLAAFVAAIYLVSIEWWLPFGVAAGSIATFRRFRTHLWAGVDLTIGATTRRRRADYLADLALQPTAAKELRVFGLGPWLREEHEREFAKATDGVWAEQTSSRRRVMVPALASTVVTTGTLFGVISLVESGRLGLTEIALTVLLLGRVRGGFTSIDNNMLNVEHGVSGLPALDELERALLDDPRIHLTGSEPAADLPAREIRFEGVHFTYPSTANDIYAGLDLVIEAGKSLAVVGMNGAGKTTLVKLLARLYDPTAGTISVDGIDLATIDPAAWQPRVSAIFQDFIRYELSARDNVAFGAPHANISDDDIRTAAADAGILDAIESLPSGWDTILSRQYEGGADLSGGQWQRLALARALLAVRHGAGVLVLDEPTANLDVRAEAELYDRFLELTAGITSVVISHRFSTVRRADRIVVIDGGRVVEDGTHDELVALGGQYARAFSVQAARFIEDEHDTGDSPSLEPTA